MVQNSLSFLRAKVHWYMGQNSELCGRAAVLRADVTSLWHRTWGWAVAVLQKQVLQPWILIPSDKGAYDMLDLKILIAIGGSLLIVTIVLMAVVLCLYYKLFRTLKASKASVPQTTSSNNQITKTQATVSTESYPSLKCYDQCKACINYNPPPPCYYDINEGL
ncbi:protein FAM24A isoform 1-T1 [Lycaon pictus]|eukprot:XP_005637874.1 protein FAM24A [Canis lupus familiaris]